MVAFLKPLIDISPVRFFKAGSTILHQGEVPEKSFLITDGVVRIYNISESGDEQTLMFHVPGEFFPLTWIFGDSKSTLFFYEAMTDCEINMIDRGEFLEFMTSDQDRSKSLVRYFTNIHSTLLLRINALEQSKARDKLIHTFYYLYKRYNRYKQQIITLPFLLTHQNLACLIGLTRETTTIEVNKLRKERVVSCKKQRYTLDVRKLMAVMGTEST
jgi:CRP-like cAMP-binding protein